MTSKTLRVSEAQVQVQVQVHDIGEEELDFSDLFGDGFASYSDQGVCVIRPLTLGLGLLVCFL